MNHLGHGLGMMLGAAGSSSSFTWTGCCWVHGLAPILAFNSQPSVCLFLSGMPAHRNPGTDNILSFLPFLPVGCRRPREHQEVSASCGAQTCTSPQPPISLAYCLSSIDSIALVAFFAPLSTDLLIGCSSNVTCSLTQTQARNWVRSWDRPHVEPPP